MQTTKIKPGVWYTYTYSPKKFKVKSEEVITAQDLENGKMYSVKQPGQSGEEWVILFLGLGKQGLGNTPYQIKFFANGEYEDTYLRETFCDIWTTNEGYRFGVKGKTEIMLLG
jgi:hypothetical protein